MQTTGTATSGPNGGNTVLKKEQAMQRSTRRTASPIEPLAASARGVDDQKAIAVCVDGGPALSIRRCVAKRSPDMDRETKHEIVLLTLGTLAAVPFVTGIGLAVVAGVLAW